MDDKTPWSNPGTMAQALAIRDGKIIAAGGNQQILGLKGPQTKIVDLKGRTVVPGIIDTHSHLFDYALDATGATIRYEHVSGLSRERLGRASRRRFSILVKVEAAKKKPGEWIALDLPREGIGQDGKPMDGIVASRRGVIVNRKELDELAPNNPVYLKVRTTSILNSKAMDIVKKIWAGPMEPDLMREDGFSSNTLNRIIGSDFLIPTLEQLAQLYKEENLRWASYGVTT